MSRFARIKGPRPIYILAASLAGGAIYRFSKPASSNADLDPHDFTPYILVDKDPISPTNAIFTLKNGYGRPEPDSVKGLWERGVWSVEIKQPQLQIARSYTPLPPSPTDITDDDGHELRILIRQETGGEVSTYLHRLPAGSTIELRGPHIEHELPCDVKDIIFLAGGTGIAPALQVAHIFNGTPGNKLQLLWANRRREECEGGNSDEAVHDRTVQRSSWHDGITWFKRGNLREDPVQRHDSARKGLIVQQLEALKARNQGAAQKLYVQYYVDEEKTFIKPDDVARRLHTGLSEGKGSRLILVSGPDGFVEHWAGKKVWVDGREVQGPLGGVLAKMDLGDWKVIKL